MANKWTLFIAVFVICTVLAWYSFNCNITDGLSIRFGKQVKIKEMLFFFRVPKTGSEMTAMLLQWLQGVNNFRHVRLQNTVHRRLDMFEQVGRALFLCLDCPHYFKQPSSNCTLCYCI